MPDPTQDATGIQIVIPEPPAIMGGAELYDAIMSQIEPELTRAGLAALDAAYQNETPEEKAARAARYNAAFAEYGKRFQQYNTDWMGQFTVFQRQALASVENADRQTEEQGNDVLLEKIQQFS